MNLKDTLDEPTTTEERKIETLEEKISELNRTIALLNEDKIKAKSKSSIKGLSSEEMFLEALSTEGIFNTVIVSKHVDSDYVTISFIGNDSKPLTIYMTEKSYLKFHEVIDVFKLKLKSINMRQFE